MTVPAGPKKAYGHDSSGKKHGRFFFFPGGSVGSPWPFFGIYQVILKRGCEKMKESIYIYNISNI